jgi:drug/metabolite transporter (DMT)-like permease
LASIGALGTGIFYGIYLVITRKLHTSDTPLLTLLFTGVVGLIVASLFVPFVWINLTVSQWSLLALMGIFACLGHFFLILSLKYADASKLAPFSYFEIVTNLLLGHHFFGDFPNYWTWIGLSIIISSGVYIYFRERSFVKD